MGPTTAALLRFYQADRAFHAAQERLAAATSSVRGQGSKVDGLRKAHDAAHQKALELEAKARELELELKSREERIELLRERQTNATDQKQYGALIVDINTQKLDKQKFEEQALATMEQAEATKKQVAELKATLDAEAGKHNEMSGQIDSRVQTLSAEVDAAKGPRDELAATISPMVMATYRRASERYEGEAMASIEKPDPRDVEYLCNGCNTYLVANIYNRLMSSKDEVVLCPNCARILYVPEALTPEIALSKKLARGEGPAKPKKAPKAPKLNPDGTPVEKKPRAPRAKKGEASASGASVIAAGKNADPNSLAAALASGALAATGKGHKGNPVAGSAPLPSRGDGQANVAEHLDAPPAPEDVVQPATPGAGSIAAETNASQADAPTEAATPSEPVASTDATRSE